MRIREMVSALARPIHILVIRMSLLVEWLWNRGATGCKVVEGGASQMDGSLMNH